MIVIRLICAVLSGLGVYFVLWFPSSLLIKWIFAKHMQSDGSTENIWILLLSLSMHMDFAVGAGFVTAWIARTNVWGCAAVVCVIEFACFLFLQEKYSVGVLMWYRYVFLGVLIAGVFWGTKFRLDIYDKPRRFV